MGKEISCPAFFALEERIMLLVWTSFRLQTLKNILPVMKYRQAGAPREERGPKILIRMRMKFFAMHGWLLARILSMGLINHVPHFGEKLKFTMRNTINQEFLAARVPLCIGSWQFRQV
jgi:hypothetical protein